MLQFNEAFGLEMPQPQDRFLVAVHPTGFNSSSVLRPSENQIFRRRFKVELRMVLGPPYGTTLFVFWTVILFIRIRAESTDFDRCGVGPVLTGRIVGGNESEPNKWPWQASLMLTHPQYGKVGHWCGAVIVSKVWVMTAAHCILNPLFSLPQPVFWKVRVGDHNLKLTEGPEKTIQVEEVHFHPWYHAYDKDIALLKLEKELEFNDYIRPICIPDEEAGYLGMRCIATGWGKVDFNKKGSNVLREVEIQVLDNSICHAAYYPNYKIPIRGWHLCAGTTEGGKGTCQGDSGGPLQCLVNGQYYVAGITSFGSGCAKEGYPDIYTRVSYFADWIEEIMTRPPAGK